MTEKNEPARNASRSDAGGEKKYPEPIVGALIVDKDGKILLARSKKCDNKYTIFYGHVEWRESIEDALKRETKEETGLDVQIIDQISFGENTFEKDFEKKNHCIFFEFLCDYSGSGEEVKIDEREFQKEYKWAEPKEALKLELGDRTKRVIELYLNKKESENALDSWKRCQADFENFKKDQAKHQEEFLKYAKMDVIEQILPVVDNFEASLAHVPNDKKENKWVEGIVYIKKQLEDVLKNNDIEEIEVKPGDKFDPEKHEAVAGEGEKVKNILQKGYKLNGRIARAARVEVT